MSRREKCFCGEHAVRTCRSCLRRMCRFCMITDFVCSMCQSRKRKKIKDELHRKTKNAAARLRELYWQWNDFNRDTVHDQEFSGSAKPALKALSEAGDIISRMYEENKDDNKTGSDGKGT